jgi:hypothetical protein
MDFPIQIGNAFIATQDQPRFIGVNEMRVMQRRRIVEPADVAHERGGDAGSAQRAGTPTAFSINRPRTIRSRPGMCL